ncbi:complement C1q subcomponent subunit C-like [Genypterus blacodes]|uniref:complement C1q subcomponent subunit C-like n=1 Tax=Genypterus blacodes TaxID=154954 RepID=UPI003F75D9A9
MGRSYWLMLLVGVAWLLPPGQCDVNCRGTDGQPGVPGHPGREGLAGVKGEKGEPALLPRGPVDDVAVMWLKGNMGNQGAQGPTGPKGFHGEVGTPGPPGLTGQPGPERMGIGQGHESSQQTQSAFSVIRTSNTYPAFNQVVTFQSAIVNKPSQDFNIQTGYFTCRVPGVYYFVFHSVSKVSMCLQIASDALQEKLGFCKDKSSQFDQVLSGGVVLQLVAGQKVWLESFKDQQAASVTRDTADKQIIFNGFLLF